MDKDIHKDFLEVIFGTGVSRWQLWWISVHCDKAVKIMIRARTALKKSKRMAAAYESKIESEKEREEIEQKIAKKLAPRTQTSANS